MNDNELHNYFEHLRSQRMAEANQERLKRSILRKAAADRPLTLSFRLGRSIGGVIARRRSARATRMRPVRIEDCVGLETS
jgi:hypothetical protein